MALGHHLNYYLIAAQVPCSRTLKETAESSNLTIKHSKKFRRSRKEKTHLLFAPSLLTLTRDFHDYSAPKLRSFRENVVNAFVWFQNPIHMILPSQIRKLSLFYRRPKIQKKTSFSIKGFGIKIDGIFSSMVIIAFLKALCKPSLPSLSRPSSEIARFYYFIGRLKFRNEVNLCRRFLFFELIYCTFLNALFEPNSWPSTEFARFYILLGTLNSELNSELCRLFGHEP